MTTEDKVTVIYARVGEDQAIDRNILSRQAAVCLDYAQRNSLASAITFSDVGPASTGVRPGFDQMMDLVRRDSVTNIVVISLCRLACKVDQATELLAELAAHNVQLRVINGGDMADFARVVEWMEKRDENRRKAMANLEREDMEYRKRLGRAAAKERREKK